jgi:hypothetical protein
VGYLDNLMKEAKDLNKASQRRSNSSAKGDTYPPNDIAPGGKGREYWANQANIARRDENSQFGQMLGALLQGRRYDDKTGKQIKATKKGKK